MRCPMPFDRFKDWNLYLGGLPSRARLLPMGFSVTGRAAMLFDIDGGRYIKLYHCGRRD